MSNDKYSKWHYNFMRTMFHSIYNKEENEKKGKWKKDINWKTTEMQSKKNQKKN